MSALLQSGRFYPGVTLVFGVRFRLKSGHSATRHPAPVRTDVSRGRARTVGVALARTIPKVGRCRPARPGTTRHGLRQEKNRWRSTNYGRGTLVPINTRVRVDDITSSTIRLTIVATGKALKLSNIEKYTGGGTDVLAYQGIPGIDEDVRIHASTSPNAGSLIRPGVLDLVFANTEILDLLAFLEVGGDPTHHLFRK